MKSTFWILATICLSVTFAFSMNVGAFDTQSYVSSDKVLKVKELKMDIAGMSCFRCAEKIEKKIGRLEGVIEIKVNLEEKNAQIKFDDSMISTQQIKDKIKEMGYEPGQYFYI